ncbi:MAG: type I-D CRISPR-associated protein Cas7/Csc2 [Anaerolineae bacterium]|nr:type I-D CRISPR-associated protein Cas7/Csc2 [Anaerolineae bacterium]
MLNTEFFHSVLPDRPNGKYAHIVMLRVTEGYALFQTDGELNRARVSAGVETTDLMTRIALFKRKQTTPERLNGRELLRRFGILCDIADALPSGAAFPENDKEVKKLADAHNSEREEPPFACFYNVVSCCRCPDCISYGFAIGDGGSEKSKIYAETAYSLTDYAHSHEVFTLNAPYEDGTMSDKGVPTSRINQQDHVKPQTIFPAVLTARDLTPSLFGYVLGNVMRTTRYGATTTRGGTVRNHIMAIVLSDGEIFSNLLFTQRLFDVLGPLGVDPVKVNDALEAAEQIVPELLKADSVRDQQILMGADLSSFLNGVRAMDEKELSGLLKQAVSECQAYYEAHIAKPEKGKGKAK